jgi:hypothetical protein
MLSPGLFESFGRWNLNEHERFVLLTDGGHFENLDLYELLRLRLKLIVVCDATADPEHEFADLANAIENVRADFGAIVEVSREDPAVLMPCRRDGAAKGDQEQRLAERGDLIAPIRYSLRSGQSSSSTPDRGWLIVLKATFFKQLSADLHGYRQAHNGLPNQLTGDQFFDERQFEAYRELGYQTAWPVLLELRADASDSASRLKHEGAALLWG